MLEVSNISASIKKINWLLMVKHFLCIFFAGLTVMIIVPVLFLAIGLEQSLIVTQSVSFFFFMAVYIAGFYWASHQAASNALIHVLLLAFILHAVLQLLNILRGSYVYDWQSLQDLMFTLFSMACGYGIWRIRHKGGRETTQ